ncbi:TPA: efflux RND transporter permease subunit [Acinetobacter baumannii]|uniref:Efflux RND transporter permease subunit n=33 Tax=Gammaproteobacteria TaxID=1236 RepID=A0A1J4M495_ACIBA|nr:MULTISPECIES: efflux RND transporter permease subunit [Acinetobacter]AHX29762.1 nodulation protein NolG [Acinetobacter baumannii AC12]AHX64056.1 nodulation protein NolG [Acinetobacter baumannii AC30]EMT86593.1 cation/multidrug efflux pump [Acinetobacter baumannii ABNIH5]ETY68770.1 nodulation protein NolG [Acinetobacter baumannii MDR_MMC4]KCW29777.1 MMPL family protein [Acinetobacter baumannii 6935]HBY5620244.1 efflux RND transporter permease subunit [Klebsiella pneumoniae]
MWFTRISVKYPVFTIMMMLSLMVLGLASWKRMTVEEFPNIDFPFVVVTTQYAGASPEAVESDITKKLEDQINTISGIKQITSRSSEGLSMVIAEFNLDTSSAIAAQDVRDKIAPVIAQFRDEIDTPIVQRYDPSSSPIMSVVFESNSMSLAQLSSYVDKKIVPQLKTVSGVGNVNLLGDAKRQIRIKVHPEQLQSYGIGIDQVINTLKNENIEVPAGTLQQKNSELVVQIQSKVIHPLGFGDLVIANKNGSPIFLKQVATVEDTQAELQSSAFYNGRTAVSVDILKSSDANVIQVVDKTYQTLEKLKAQMPAALNYKVVADSSKGIRASIKDVVRTIIEGAVLAVLIVLLFLGSFRSTVITGLTLPITLLGTLTFIWAFGFSINMMTLLALSLSIGLLIDDAIVVRENIVRHTELGKDHVTAALDGTKEIGLAVLATTLTIVAVFLPVAFMGGLIGRFFYQFGVTVSTAVLISMFISFTLDPMLSAHWKDPVKKKESRLQRFFNYISNLLDGLTHIYEKLLKLALRFRFITVIIAIVSLVVALGLSKMIGTEFVPTPDKGEIRIQFETPVDSSLEYTQAKLHQVDQIIRQFPDVVSTYGVVNSEVDSGKNHAGLGVTLKPKQERSADLTTLNNEFRDRLQSVAGIRVTSVAAAQDSVSGGQKPIMISIKGSDLNELQKISDRFMAEMEKIDGVVDLESSLKEPKPTLGVHINRVLASDLGLSVSQIANAIRPLIAGDNVTTWEDRDGETYDVNIRLNENKRVLPQDVQNLYLNSNKTNANGQNILVPLSAVATTQEKLGASQINRRDLEREVLIEANTSGRPSGDIGQDIDKMQKAFKLPAGYTFDTQGANADMAESAGYALTAITLSIVFIYIVLGSQFNSFIHPAAIMASLPLSLIGVFLALFLFRSTLNLFSIIGIIMLMGLVTKNAILLIDFIKKAMEDGISRYDAILQAGKTRLRPILMTTSAMVMGMVPLALGLGEGGEQSAPMAHAVIGGVITSTLLTLVVVPVIFTYLDDLKNFMLRQTRRFMS